MIELESLPIGWTIAKLDDVIIRMTNGANAVQYKEQVGLPISRIETISNETIDLGRVKYIKETDANFIDKYKLRNGDILFSHINSDSHLGKTALFKIENRVTLIHGINLLLLRPSPEILPEIINYQIQHLRAQGKFSAIAQKAVNQSSINQAKLKTFEICVPPLNEQKRILAKLEQLLTDLDKGIKFLETTKQQLKVYRQAVLDSAFSGKLTNSKLKEGELPNGWKELRIFEVAEVNPSLPNKENLSRELDVQFIPMKLVEEIINKVHLTETRKLSDVLKGSYTPFINSDILFAKVTPCMENGKIAIVENLKNSIGFGSSEFHVLRCSEKVLNKYLHRFIIQDKFRMKAQNAMTGAVGLRRVPKQFLENYLIPIPPTIDEQKKIVLEVESRISVCEKIEESIESSLQQAEALRLSIIKKAFEGKLVPQDPNDEPAEKLLERIRALRQAQDKQGKAKTYKKEKVRT